MTHRERVLAALNHQEPDRVPVDLAQAGGDGITITAYRNLINYLGLPEREIRVESMLAQSAQVDEDVLRRFDVDLRRLDLGKPDGWTDKWFDEFSYQDEWGVVRTRPKESFYYDLTRSPLADDATVSGIANHKWPDPDDPGRYRGLAERARKLRQETDFALVLQVNSSFFLRCAELRGWENWYMDLAGDPDYAVALMEKFLSIRLRILENALREVGEDVDVVFVTSDDFGMIDRPIISPPMFRKLVKPLVQKTFDFVKDRTPAKRFLHSCGSVYKLMGDFVDVGVEALNPIQVSAADMGDTARLKREFGDKLTFWGGIDTHQVLPSGTTDDVRAEVKRRLKDLAPGGGYVLCSVHNIQPEVPPENVVAMYDAALEFGQYPLKLD
jgi:uroporphyrinogen decarboxylase